MSITLPSLASVCIMLLLRPVQGFPHSSDSFNCSNDTDCSVYEYFLEKREDPSMECINGQCQCPPSAPCKHVTHTQTKWDYSYSYFCGQCKTLGAECRNQAECGPSGSTDVQIYCDRNYCQCKSDTYLYYDMCLISSITSSASITNVALTLTLLVLLIINKLITSRRARRFLRRSCRRCCVRGGQQHAEEEYLEDDGSYRNPRSDSKSASYIVGNSDFIATSEDPDLDWALELSMQVNRLTSAVHGSPNRASSSQDSSAPNQDSSSSTQDSSSPTQDSSSPNQDPPSSTTESSSPQDSSSPDSLPPSQASSSFNNPSISAQDSSSNSFQKCQQQLSPSTDPVPAVEGIVNDGYDSGNESNK